jgi:hypothetical protein
LLQKLYTMQCILNYNFIDFHSIFLELSIWVWKKFSPIVFHFNFTLGTIQCNFLYQKIKNIFPKWNWNKMFILNYKWASNSERELFHIVQISIFWCFFVIAFSTILCSTTHLKLKKLLYSTVKNYFYFYLLTKEHSTNPYIKFNLWISLNNFLATI